MLRLGSIVVLMGVPFGAVAAPPSVYPMAEAGWRAAPPVAWAGTMPGAIKFQRYEGLANGAMTVNDGIAESTSAHFSDGVIDLDIKPLAYSDTGVIFRSQGEEDGEFVYLRANPDCPAANDCIQYAPITHGLMQWDIYADKQGSAPIAPTGWNHLHLVIARDRMAVYVNRQFEPSLLVPRLQGFTKDGGIALKGPAIYANLVITPGEPDLSRVTPSTIDQGAVVHWWVAPPTVAVSEQSMIAAGLPPAGAWKPFSAEADGLVNLSRAFGTAHAPASSTGWLKAVIVANAQMRRTIKLGWSRQVTMFLNGQPVYSGDNPYYPVEKRLSPDGRLAIDNASISVDLHKGANELVLAVGNRWRTSGGAEKPSPYGWAAEVHIDDRSGLTFE